MSEGTTLKISQNALEDGKHHIRLSLKRPSEADLEAEATIEFAVTPQEQEDLRWYMEDYLQRAKYVEEVQVRQIETLMKQRGEELYSKVFTDNQSTQAIWFAVREQLADLRLEIATGVAEAASIPWELMRDPQSDSAVALRVKTFVRVQLNPNIGFVKVPEADEGRVRLLYIVCRPGGRKDVGLRAVANRLLQDLGGDRARYDITALRPPTFEALQNELKDAKQRGRPYHIVHFDGHGIYADLKDSILEDWLAALNHLTLGGDSTGEHGFLLFESPGSEHNIRPVDGHTLGQLLHDNGVPALVLNACQSAMHEADATPAGVDNAHDEVRAIGSLAQSVVDQGIPAVLGMRYSVYVVTAAQYIGELYRALARGSSFGEAASEGRKHLHLNPERWVGLEPRPLQDWFVPVVYEAMPLRLLPQDEPLKPSEQPELDPVQLNPSLVRYVPDHGFVGRDETLLVLDRAFDAENVVLLHAYAGQGKTTTAVEFARWFAQTGGLGPQPVVLFTSFESHTDLADLLNQIGQAFASELQNSGIEWYALNDPDERRNRVRELLRQNPVLWIWDNVEPVAGFPDGTESTWTPTEQSELADFLKQLKLDNATKVKVLLTSRRDEKKWLGDFPHPVQMPRMSSADAAGLALQLGKEKNLTPSEIAHWQPLLDYCAGNPLTLRIIAGQAVKMGLRGNEQIRQFVEAVRDGEQRIEDADEAQGRDKSLGASLDYGFRNAFSYDELPVIALLHLFQGTVMVNVLQAMGRVGDHALPELQGKTKEHLAGLLERARDVGLLTHIGSTYYAIHPALPWFLRQLFVQHYDGRDGRSSSEAAIRAWVEAVGSLGDYHHHRFNEGKQETIQLLVLEEANLLHARHLARRNGWLSLAIACMQGLQVLYDYQGRGAEWARLVADIVPDHCSEDDEPIPGREDDYSVVMGYRVNLVVQQERDLTLAAALQDKLVEWDRQQAAQALSVPEDEPLDDVQRHLIRTLGVGVFRQGNVLYRQGSSKCVEAFGETIKLDQRIEDTAAEAIVHLNLGHAYRVLPEIRDLDAAEAAYRRSLALQDPKDAIMRSGCFQQIGMVYHERFRKARSQNEPAETQVKHAQETEEHYLQALGLCPASAINSLGPMHNQLGNLYQEVDQSEGAQEHYEKAAQYFEQSGNYYDAGGVRSNMSVMYVKAIGQEKAPARQRDLLFRAQAYAAAAVRDFQRYEGRAPDEEANAQQLLDEIARNLAKLPQ